MDYEKLHKDTIAKLQEMVNSGKITVETACGICADFVPESEDEKIRKDIINYFYDTHDDDEERAKFIAYLEKQGEQKPAEWSEEDVEMFGNVLSTLSICSNNPDIPIDVRKMHQKEYAWFDELYNRIQPRPKQEWSGGDEAHLHSLITHLEQWIESNPDTTGADIQGENIAWLKSLRPQNTWKPSDEQMAVLNEVINYAANSDLQHWSNFIYTLLKSLREQLKKLKGE